MSFRSEEDALRERVATLEAKLADAADTVLEERRRNRPVRWFALAERFGAAFRDLWAVTAWGVAIVSTAMLILWVSTTDPPCARGSCHEAPEPPPRHTITPLGETCNNLCSNLGMRQVSHWSFSDGYRCDCAGGGRMCSWDNINGMSCVSVAP